MRSLLVALLVLPLLGQTPCVDLVLPATVQTAPPVLQPSGSPASSGFFTIRVLNGSGDLPNGTYSGWCATSPEDSLLIYEATYSLESSYAADLTSAAMREANYVLNHKQGTVAEVQSAIWFLLDGPDANNPLDSTAQSMVNEATHFGANFFPQPGQIVAAYLNINFAGFQNLFVEVSAPCHLCRN